MNEKESLEVRVNEILKQLEEHSDQAVEISKEEAEYMGSFEDDSMSMEDALESHSFEINLEDQIRPEGEAKPKVKAKIVDAAEWVKWEIEQSKKMGKGLMAVYKGNTPPSNIPGHIKNNINNIVPWKHDEIMAVVDMAVVDKAAKER